ncbi:hypothetical protein, partial [Bacteroides heparinolyticus]|uniref:hypothetical protein n=1 Tax=Prevotella heparinolytica TaxID=28113 RepID=UPI0035A07812
VLLGGVKERREFFFQKVKKRFTHTHKTSPYLSWRYLCDAFKSSFTYFGRYSRSLPIKNMFLGG